jgi:hypothetical protein
MGPAPIERRLTEQLAIGAAVFTVVLAILAMTVGGDNGRPVGVITAPNEVVGRTAAGVPVALGAIGPEPHFATTGLGPEIDLRRPPAHYRPPALIAGLQSAEGHPFMLAGRVAGTNLDLYEVVSPKLFHCWYLVGPDFEDPGACHASRIRPLLARIPVPVVLWVDLWPETAAVVVRYQPVEGGPAIVLWQRPVNRMVAVPVGAAAQYELTALDADAKRLDRQSVAPPPAAPIGS